MINEIDNMLNLQNLPIQKRGIKAHYEGSIDKTGGNADYDWALYQDENGEWVLFDYIGAGCVYNFVQHRFIASEEPVFRFYFDGEKTPCFEIKPSQFGEKYPFIEPHASKFIGPGKYEKAIRVVRSFVPMPFRRSCKITSSIKLSGEAYPGGGWGHVIYHTYSEDISASTFNPAYQSYYRLAWLWSQSGANPVGITNSKEEVSTFLLRSGEKKTVFSADSAGLVAGILCKTRGYRKSDLENLKLCAVWDSHSSCDVDAMFGCLFSNELGYHSVSYMLSGMDTNGGYYNYFPMPYSQSAVITLKNTGEYDINIDYFSVKHTDEFNSFYAENPFGYFRTSTYYPKTFTKGSDSVIATIRGNGHVIGSVVTGYGIEEGKRANCEGDARIHFDGIRTPQIESDGSESYSCYGWGFCEPPQCNPASGYDGKEFDIHWDWSMTRHLMGDSYPFLSDVHFAFESFGNNDGDMYHSGMSFYYGRDEIKAEKLSDIIIGDETSEKANSYVNLDDAPTVGLTSYFEGDDDDIPVTLKGKYLTRGSCFKVAVPEGFDYIVIRRVSDQEKGRQLAYVFINGQKIEEYPWYFADYNPYKRWLEDEFVIPSRYIKEHKLLEIKIVPSECGGRISFNEFGYQIFGARL